MSRATTPATMFRPLLALVLLLCVEARRAALGSSNPVLSNLPKYEMVRPVLMEHLDSSRAVAIDKLQLVFGYEGKEFHLDMDLHDSLFAVDYFHEEQQYDTNGNLVFRERMQNNVKERGCVFHGQARNSSAFSMAAITTCNGVQGLVMAHGEVLVIEPAVDISSGGRASVDGMHVVYRLADLKVGQHSCGVTDEENNHMGAQEVLDLFSRRMNGGQVVSKRQSTRYVELFVVNDKLRYTNKGTILAVEESSVSITNVVSSLYASGDFNPPIQVVLVAMTTWTTNDPYTPIMSGGEANVDSLISLWHNWRSNTANTPPHDNGHLYSGYDFSASTVGYAGVGTMCSPSSSGGINQMTFSSDAYAATIVAHEMGHNFGMSHDGNNNACPSSGFIMASSGCSNCPPITDWSTCSQTYLANWFNNLNRVCLDNVPDGKFGDPVCGDGYLETTEECDCGSGDCTGIDPCCNGATCTLTAGSQCSNNQPCCQNCQIVPASTQICRISVGECDIAETCDGVSADCPADIAQNAGTVCDDGFGGNGACYSGSCQSHTANCRRLSSLGYPGGPYNPCPSQAQNNGGNFCATLYCQGSGGSGCTRFVADSGYIQVDDGVPCSASQICIDQQCVAFPSPSQLPTTQATTQSLTVPNTLTQTGDQQEINEGNGVNIGVVAGISGAIVLLVVIAVVVAILVLMRRRRVGSSQKIAYGSSSSTTSIPLVAPSSTVPQTASPSPRPPMSSSSKPAPKPLPAAPPSAQKPKGATLMAKYSIDGQFYSAKVVNFQNGGYLVDFGAAYGNYQEWVKVSDTY